MTAYCSDSGGSNRVAQPLAWAFHGDGRSTHCEMLPHGDKRQLSGVGFDKSEGHPGGFYRLKAAPPVNGSYRKLAVVPTMGSPLAPHPN